MKHLITFILCVVSTAELFGAISQKKLEKYFQTITATLHYDINATNKIAQTIGEIIDNGDDNQRLMLAIEFIQIDVSQLTEASQQIYLNFIKRLIIELSYNHTFLNELTNSITLTKQYQLLCNSLYQNFYLSSSLLVQLNECISLLSEIKNILYAYTSNDFIEIKNEYMSVRGYYITHTLLGGTQYAQNIYHKSIESIKIEHIARAIDYRDFIDIPQVLAQYIIQLPETYNERLMGVFEDLIEYGLYFLSDFDQYTIRSRVKLCNGNGGLSRTQQEKIVSALQRILPSIHKSTASMFNGIFQNNDEGYEVIESFINLKQELLQQGKEYANLPPIECPEEATKDPMYDKYVDLYIRAGYYCCREMNNSIGGILSYIVDQNHINEIKGILYAFGYLDTEFAWQDCFTSFLCQLSYMSKLYYYKTYQSWLIRAIYLEVSQIIQLCNIPHNNDILNEMAYTLASSLPIFVDVTNDKEFAKYIMDTFLLPYLPKANLKSKNAELNCLYSEIYAMVLSNTLLYEDNKKSGDFYEKKLSEAVKYNACEQKNWHIHSLSDYYYRKGDYEKAKKYLNEFLQQTKDTIDTYAYFYDIEYNEKNYSKAAEYADWVNKTDSTVVASLFTENGLHPAYVYSLNGETSKAQQQINVYKSYITNQFAKLLLSPNENYTQTITNKFVAIDNTFARIITDTLSPSLHNEFAKAFYDWQLMQKGLLLTMNKEAESILTQHPSKYVRQQYTNYKSVQKQLAENQNLKEDERQLLQWNLETSQLCLQQAIDAYIDYHGYSNAPIADWQEIRDMLKDNEVAIEFASGSQDESDTLTYFALLLRSDSDSPITIPLFKEYELLRLTKDKNENYIYNDVRNNQQIVKLLIQPLSDYISPGDKIYFAATGLIHQIALENMYFDDEQLLSDVYELHRVSSTKHLLRNSEQISGFITTSDTIRLYGGIKYSVGKDTLLAESRSYPDQQIAHRSINRTGINKGQAEFLKGTLREVEDISNLLSDRQYRYRLYTGIKANEESFKSLDSVAAPILHIATHGFFWQKDSAASYQYYKNGISEEQILAYIEPLRRCGLLMSGANLALCGKASELPEGVQDGVLTGQEIAVMDLSGTELLVLSACETGVGEVNGDGVFGLQRAFKKAGVQTIIMSLWQVDDRATQRLMTEFYTNYITRRQPKREAFRNAQNAVRAKYEEPTYWAGFIMLD